jgi:hypothetical protein
VSEIGSMAERMIVYWRDIPAQVLVRRGRQRQSAELGQRFVQAIDRCAMRTGAAESEAYLAAWRRGSPEPCGDDLGAELSAAVEGIERSYDPERLNRLVAAGGFEGTSHAA